MRGFQTADQEDGCNVRPGSAGGCRLLISLLFLHTFGWLCFAQSALPESAAGAEGLGYLTGTVTDSSHAPLPRATIEARDAQGNAVAAARTDNRGEFKLSLPQGKYSLSVTLAGFKAIKDQPVKVGQSTPPLDLFLEVGGIEEQVVVTATRTEAAVSQVGNSVSVVTRDELSRNGAVTVAEALREVAGMSIVQSGGHGQVTSLFVRGGESDNTKVLLDGIPVNDPGGSFNFANLSVADIDHIEVVRGPQSALYGSDAIAGTLQVFTRRGTSEKLWPTPRFAVEGGSLSTTRYAGGIEGSGDHGDYALSFTRFDTDNDVLNGSFNQETVAANVGWKATPGLELRSVFRSDYGRAGVPGPWAILPPDPEEYYRHRNLTGGVAMSYSTTPSWTQRASYSVNSSWQFSADPRDSGAFTAEYGDRTAPWPSFDLVYQTLNDTETQRVNYESEVALPGNHLLTAGAGYEHESGVIGDPQAEPLRASRDNFGAYFQDQWEFRNLLFATAGVRLENNGSFGFYAAPRASVAWHAHRPAAGSTFGLTNLRANFGLGIKEPTLVESFSQSPYFRGNPDLQPEKARSFDAGVEQSLAAGRMTVAATYFHNSFFNQIGYAVTDYQTFEGTFLNIGKTRARGLELTVRAIPGKHWEVNGGYTYLDSTILTSSSPFDPVYATGQQLLRRPANSGYLDLRWNPRRWSFGATALMVGSRVDSDFAGLGILKNPVYLLLNVVADFRVNKYLSVYAFVGNVLNTDYMEVFGYPALPANFRIGIRTGF
jgi:outer membrane cobalamin receptor